MGVPIVIEHEQLTFNAACFSQFNFCTGNSFTHRGNSAKGKKKHFWTELSNKIKKLSKYVALK